MRSHGLIRLHYFDSHLKTKKYNKKQKKYLIAKLAYQKY